MTRAQPSLSAYVLHSHAWSESSLILELFSREQGRLLVVAKGAKRPYSQMRAVLLPFQRLSVQLSRPRAAADPPHAPQAAEVLTLKSAEWGEGAGEGGGIVWAQGAVRPSGLPPELLLSGFYLSELVLRLLPRGEPWPEVFDAYGWALAALAAPGPRPEAGEPASVLRAFECVALRASGCLPDLRCEAMSGRGLEPTGVYTLAPELGLMPAAARPSAPAAESSVGALSGQVWLGLHSAMQARHLPALRAACAQPAPQDVALRQALRGVLDMQLNQLGVRALSTPRVAREAQSL